MPHQCVTCNKLYDDGSNEILQGCNCGGRLFFFIRKEKLEEMKNVAVSLTKEEKKEIEKDVLDLVGEEHTREQPVVLDLESIRVLKPGKFEIDLVHLFKKEPLVYKLEEGKYIIDLPETFKKKEEVKGKGK